MEFYYGNDCLIVYIYMLMSYVDINMYYVICMYQVLLISCVGVNDASSLWSLFRERMIKALVQSLFSVTTAKS